MNAPTSTPIVRVKEIAYTGYPVTDITRARAFYENVLGLKPATTFDHEGKTWIEYEVGAATLAISNMSEQWKPSLNGPSLALEVEDFGQALEALRAAGVTFYVEPMDFPSCQFAAVSDPDGNSLIIHQRRPQG